jgi:predicted alpha/beta-fold hydrolase
MPLIESTYARPWYMVHPHVETVYPNRFRPAPRHDYIRERMELEDGDFMDLDWLRQAQPGPKKRLALLAHGLEGDSNRPYVRGMAQTFYSEGWDVLAWNCRSCSGEINRNFCLYHHGVSHDLEEVIEAVKDDYDEISLIGFSMGGAIILKYLGKRERLSQNKSEQQQPFPPLATCRTACVPPRPGAMASTFIFFSNNWEKKSE